MYKFTPLNTKLIKKSHTFNSIDDFFLFCKKNSIYLRDFDINLIKNGDTTKQRGVLYSTSYGELRKGEREMTGYTSY